MAAKKLAKPVTETLGRGPTGAREYVLVPDGELLEAQSGETQAEDFREFQLVLDPEFLYTVNYFHFSPDA